MSVWEDVKWFIYSPAALSCNKTDRGECILIDEVRRSSSVFRSNGQASGTAHD